MRWEHFKAAVEMNCTDLREMLREQTVSGLLIDTIATMEWVVSTKPWNLAAWDAAAQTIADVLNDWRGLADRNWEDGNTEVAVRIRKAENNVFSAAYYTF